MLFLALGVYGTFFFLTRGDRMALRWLFNPNFSDFCGTGFPDPQALARQRPDIPPEKAALLVQGDTDEWAKDAARALVDHHPDHPAYRWFVWRGWRSDDTEWPALPPAGASAAAPGEPAGDDAEAAEDGEAEPGTPDAGGKAEAHPTPAPPAPVDEAAVPPRADIPEGAEERFADTVAWLRAGDPGNGWIPLLEAARAAREGVQEYEGTEPDPAHPGQTRPATRYRVVHPGHALRAAERLAAAMRADTFTQYLEPVAREQYALSGGRPASYAAYIRQVGLFAGLLLPYLTPARDLAHRAAAIAEYRMEHPDRAPGAPDAEAILRDLAMFGAKIGADAVTLIEALVGLNILVTATNEGDRILRAAGRDDAADALADFARRAASRPFLYAGILNRANRAARRPSPLLDDPALAAEADAAKAARDAGTFSFDRDFLMRRGGILAAMLLSAMERSAVLPPSSYPTPGQVDATGHFEMCGVARLSFLVAWPWALPAALLLLWGWYGMAWGGRPCNPDNAPPWPSPAWSLVAGALAAVVAALPFFVFFGSAGNWMGGPLLAMSDRIEAHLFVMAVWNLFWIVWGGAVALALLRLAAERAAPPEADGCPAPRYRGMLLGSLLSAAFMAAVLWGRLVGTGSVRFLLFLLAGVACMLFAVLPGLIHAALALLGGPRNRRHCGAARRVAAGATAALMLSCLAYPALAAREAAASRRDNMLLGPPDAEKPAIFTPLEMTLTAVLRDASRAALAEGFRDAPRPAADTPASRP